MKMAFLDIETSSLVANNGKGYMLCASMKMGGEKGSVMATESIQNNPRFGQRLKSGKFNLADDTNVAKFICNWFRTMDPDYVVTHFGDQFDLTFINTRLVGAGLRRLDPIRSIDTWKIAKYKMRLGSNTLDQLAQHLGLKEQKMPVPMRVWQDAALGDKSAMATLMRRCESDVRVLEMIYEKIIPLTRELRGSLF